MAGREDVDPVTAEVVRCAMETVAYEMATHVSLTATTPILNQSNERNATILDATGRLAALSVGIPQFMLSSTLPVRFALDFFAEEGLQDGDVLVANDPYHGGGHLPDYNVFAPVVVDGELVLIASIQCHHADTGGGMPGGYNIEAVDIWAEGVRFPAVKVYERGVERRDVVYMLAVNNRTPTFIGDIRSQIGAAQLGVRRLAEIVARHGVAVVRGAVEHGIAHAARRFREEVAGWPDGSYEAEVLIDHDTVGHQDIRVHMNCIVDGDQLTIDMTGSDDRPELVCVWNTFSNSRGYAMAQLASMVDPTIPKNEGLFNAVEMIIPEGSILQPPPNKPAGLGAFHPAVEVGEAICIALSGILPDRASPQVYKIGMPNAVIGKDQDGRMWMDQGVDVRASDASATRGIDGWGSMCSGLGNLMLATAEDVESRFPVINLSREMTTDTGGAGHWRGQPGTRNVKQVLEPVTAMTWMVSRRHSLRGLQGGDDAAAYSNHFLVGTPDEYEIEISANDPLPAGAIMAYQYGGGAGFGNPLLRDPEAVREDVLDEYVSIGAAHDRYGVVLTGSVEEGDVEVDKQATRALREELARGTGQ
jgi:N-methylhydantoinase B